MKSKLKSKLTNNFGLKVISVLSALLIWFIVVNINDSVKTKPFEVPVTISNKSAVTSLNKIYHVLDDSDKIVVTVETRESILDELSEENFTAKADMLELSDMGTIPIEVTCSNKKVGIADMSWKPQNLKIEIEDTDTKLLKVGVSTIGTPGSGYVVGSKTPSPNSVEVTGPKSVVKKVKSAVAEVNVEGLTADQTVNAQIKLLDSDGDPIDTTNLQYVGKESGITVKIELFKTKEIPVICNSSGTPAVGYQVREVVSDPATITIAGKESSLQKINNITVPEGQLSVRDASADVQKIVDITAYITEKDVKVVDPVDEDGKSEVLLIAYIEQTVTKDIVISTDKIVVSSAPEGYSYSYPSASSITLPVQALQRDMDNFNEEEVKTSIDLSNYSRKGTYTVPVAVDLPAPYTIKDQVYVQIELTKK